MQIWKYCCPFQCSLRILFETGHDLTYSWYFAPQYGYMAPEQFQNRATLQTDLYGLGGTMLYMLSGRPPSYFPQVWNLRFHWKIKSSSVTLILRACIFYCEDSYNNNRVARQRRLKVEFRDLVTMSIELANVVDRLLEPAPEDRFQVILCFTYVPLNLSSFQQWHFHSIVSSLF